MLNRLKDLYSGPHSTVPIDWAAFQSALGVRVPKDYEGYCEHFPPGLFQDYLTIYHPAQNTGEDVLRYTGALVEMIEEFADFDDPPFPLTVGAGGLIAWGIANVSPYFCWIANSENPDEWPTLIIEDDGSRWQQVDRPMTEVLTEVLFGAERLSVLADYDALKRTPVAFEPFEKGPVSDVPGEAMPVSYDGRPLREPVDAVDALLEVSGAAASGLKPHRNLPRPTALEPSIFPADYRRLIDRVPTLRIADVALLVPGDQATEHDWHAQMALLQDVARMRRDNGGHAFLLWPAPGGLIPWARTEREEVCCWLPHAADPDSWPVAVLAPDGLSVDITNRSATGYLLHRLTDADVV
ncbi:hypothetical protein [Cryptosporangium aurantiacum]|uniref:SMI1-KNR4 cell-wall n=1 Tax=Cryptosporangium aurantiacum TaxID=134849 RepID=A0A1M7REQ7_9ACTN|nr:hypothetical protein [Cryptosporangium aurantiacum]SHN44662.1 hypothetical protein SAMN05443668_110311 [Cryptosporangium aurantiacum]